MDLGLRDKSALVTGGSRGIGLAVAKGLAREGVTVVVCSRDQCEVQSAAQEIEKEYGVRALGVKADVTKVEDIERIVDRIKGDIGGIDILVNNAGTGSKETIMDAPDQKWQDYWDLHVMASVRLCRASIPFMKTRGGGVIINNASICARQPLGYEPIYNVTKSALVMFSKCLANEVIKDNIRVNCINPGLILTPDWHKTASLIAKDMGTTPEQYLDQIARENAPIARFADPEELANVFVFLCSPKASYCVGSTYYVDGGWLRVVV
jgi:NAD(P)-dependent dehydrogenase (short-subunit alcohol dehydrogenase family)